MGSSLLLLFFLCLPVSAFIVPTRHSSWGSLRGVKVSESQLMMSSSLAKKRDNSLPPPPEDQLILSGDVASLFIYSFLDHSVNDLYLDVLQSGGMDSAKTLDPFNEFGATAHLPVWFDALHTMLPKEQILTLLSIPNVNYAPLLQTAGTASITLTGCWLLCGWIGGAFLFRNTLECHTTRMLWVTLKTWVIMATLVVLLALGSDMIMGNFNHVPPLGGLTKADADYIFDSLTVLITWRFMVSSLLGGLSKK